MKKERRPNVIDPMMTAAYIRRFYVHRTTAICVQYLTVDTYSQKRSFFLVKWKKFAKKKVKMKRVGAFSNCAECVYVCKNIESLW